MDREEALRAFERIVSNARIHVSPVRGSNFGATSGDVDVVREALTDKAGWKLVPEEPTDAMKKAGYMAHGDSNTLHNKGEIYRAMIAAAPTTGEPSDG